MYFGIISKLSYFCCAVHLLSYYIWSFCALAKFTYFVILCILDNRCKRLKFNQYTFNKTTARPSFFSRAVWQRYQTRFKTPDSHIVINFFFILIWILISLAEESHIPGDFIETKYSNCDHYLQFVTNNG